jgi:nucleotide-binding universal stress UspA family protein
MSFRVPESHWICKEKESESESTCRALTNLAERSNTDILVLGNCGAKHVSKATLGSSTSGLPPLGSVTAGAIRESHASICIVRANSPLVTPNQRLKFVFCTDGSHASAIGFCLLVGQIARPRDTVDVVTVTSGDGDCERQLMDQYQQYLKAKGVEGEARIKTINLRETTVSEGIISAAEEAEADILVLGIANYGQVKLGSMSDYAVRHCPTTVLILKDSAEVSAGRSSRLMGAQDELMRSNTLSRSTSMQRRATSDSFDLPSFQRMTADIKQTMHNLPTIPSLTFLEINS